MKHAAWWLLGALAGCSLAPPYERPAVQVPAAYKEAPADNAASSHAEWKAATPADAAARGAWWGVFEDPLLDTLEVAAGAQNQDLQAAFARVERSRALVRVARAAQRPRLDFGATASHRRDSPNSQQNQGGSDDPYSSVGVRLTASYEVDLFGRVRDSVRAARADLAADQALLESLRLSLQSDVAENYFRLRAADHELVVLHATIDLAEQALTLLEAQYAAGEISEFDVNRVTAEVEGLRVETFATERARAGYEHALAVLTGQPPAAFSLAARPPVDYGAAAIPSGVPSTLLERRPDIAAAERHMIAANARIGVAKAAFYPVLNLEAGGGFEGDSLGNLFEWGSRTWALGPLAGALLTLPIFDGGRNAANLAAAEAELDAEIAQYRQVVLTAFGEVEDALVGLRTLAGQLSANQRAIDAAERASTIGDARFAAGATGYLDVIDARRTVVAVRRQQAQLLGSRAVTTVALIRALGGGW